MQTKEIIEILLFKDLKSFLACEIECGLYEEVVLPAIERYEEFVNNEPNVILKVIK